MVRELPLALTEFTVQDLTGVCACDGERGWQQPTPAADQTTNRSKMRLAVIAMLAQMDKGG